MNKIIKNFEFIAVVCKRYVQIFSPNGLIQSFLQGNKFRIKYNYIC